MSLGFDAISALPFATSTNIGAVNVQVTGNALTITIGSVGIIADSIVEAADPNRLTLGLGTLTISGKANVTVTKNELSLGLGTITVTAAANAVVTGNALTLATGNALTITIGSVGIIADSIVEDPDPNRLTLGTGALTISGKANITLTKNELSLGLGSIVVTADANVTAVKNALTLAVKNVTVTGAANINPDKVSLALDTVEPGVITWNDIIPGATMVWTPIKPY